MGCVARLCCMTTALAAYVLAQLARHPRRRIRHRFFGRRRMRTARNSCRRAGTRVSHRWPICCWGRLFPRLPSPLESRWSASGFPDSSRQKPIRGSGLATLLSGSLVQAAWLTRQRKASSTDSTPSGPSAPAPGYSTGPIGMSEHNNRRQVRWPVPLIRVRACLFAVTLPTKRNPADHDASSV